MKHLAGALVLLSVAGADLGAERPDDPKPGLIGEYFDVGSAIEDFPSVDGKQPAVRRLDKELNWDATGEKFAGTELEDHFYVRWTGLLRVPKDGTYTLFTESDDGSRLWIDGKKVVENGGLHGMEEKSGTVELKAGDHDLKVELFENEGEVGLKVSWQADGLAKQIIPASAYLHKHDEKLDK